MKFVVLFVFLFLGVVSGFLVENGNATSSTHQATDQVIQNMYNLIVNEQRSRLQLQKLVTTLSKKVDKLEHAQGQIQTEFLQNFTKRLNETNVSVGFAVSDPDNSSGSALKFKQVIYNSGDDYSLSSGVFTCRYPGLYFFTATLFRKPGLRESACDFSVNGIDQLSVNSGTDVNAGYQSGSASLVYRLKAGDIVMLSDCIGINYLYAFSSFTGFRVSY
ncbi:complement C1q and tumor necrosis factor-related protein 9A-like [Ruditapes philippinarum]|uniref:complement C1q and tumor necrosis factor-related protein 9A-like n=1 Tax=Ruditapes philippinarum TaxID=129788 RepID=UPI00295AD42E|nr:complement C1q and tumor necrosis factor-related protein 9A-like [Ruditapes philippinarum]